MFKIYSFDSVWLIKNKYMKLNRNVDFIIVCDEIK